MVFFVGLLYASVVMVLNKDDFVAFTKEGKFMIIATMEDLVFKESIESTLLEILLSERCNNHYCNG